MALISRTLLNWFSRYNTYHRNWRPATATHQILVPRYKSTGDIVGFNQLRPKCWEPVSSCVRKISATVHQIYSGHHIDPTNPIYLIFTK
jgi:hypothetical protein